MKRSTFYFLIAIAIICVIAFYFYSENQELKDNDLAQQKQIDNQQLLLNSLQRSSYAMHMSVSGMKKEREELLNELLSISERSSTREPIGFKLPNKKDSEA